MLTPPNLRAVVPASALRTAYMRLRSALNPDDDTQSLIYLRAFRSDDGGHVELVANASPVAVRSEHAAHVEVAGEIAINGHLLGKAIGTLDDDKVSLVSIGTASLELRAGRLSHTLPGADSEFLAGIVPPEVPDNAEFRRIDRLVFAGMLRRVAHAMAKDESKYNLCGIHVEPMPDGALRVAATDGHRAAIFDYSDATHFGCWQPNVIPRASVNGLLKALESFGSHVEMAITEQCAVFRAEGLTVTAMIDAMQFPDVQEVIPKAITARVDVERKSLIEALKKVVKLHDRTIVVLSATPESLAVVCGHEPTQSKMWLQATGGYRFDLVTQFNSRYLVDALDSIQAKYVELRMGEPGEPLVIVPKGVTGDLRIVMEYKLTDEERAKAAKDALESDPNQVEHEVIAGTEPVSRTAHIKGLVNDLKKQLRDNNASMTISVPGRASVTIGEVTPEEYLPTKADLKKARELGRNAGKAALKSNHGVRVAIPSDELPTAGESVLIEAELGRPLSDGEKSVYTAAYLAASAPVKKAKA